MKKIYNLGVWSISREHEILLRFGFIIHPASMLMAFRLRADSGPKLHACWAAPFLI